MRRMQTAIRRNRRYHHSNSHKGWDGPTPPAQQERQVAHTGEQATPLVRTPCGRTQAAPQVTVFLLRSGATRTTPAAGLTMLRICAKIMQQQTSMLAQHTELGKAQDTAPSRVNATPMLAYADQPQGRTLGQTHPRSGGGGSSGAPQGRNQGGRPRQRPNPRQPPRRRAPSRPSSTRSSQRRRRSCKLLREVERRGNVEGKLHLRSPNKSTPPVGK